MTTNLPALIDQHDWATATYDPVQRMDGTLRRALIGIGVLVFGFGAAATLVPIGGAVMASGQVGVESRIKRIAHPTGGTIAELHVSNGDHVNKGDVLMRLDDHVSGAQSALAALSVDQLLAQRARLEAERLGAAAITFPAELTRRSDAAATKAMADESRLFAIRRAEAGGMRAQFAARITQYQREIGGYSAQIAALQKQAKLIEPEQRGVRELYDKGLVTIGRMNQLERTSVDLQGSIAALHAQIAQTQARIAETNEQLIQSNETRRADAGQQLATVNGSLNTEQMRNVTAADQHERNVIRAPYAGVVDKVAFAAIGDVVKPAETIMEIVPDKDRMVVEAMVSPADIDQIAPGQTARIRFSAFNATTTPDIAGTVTVVAAERTVDPDTRQPFYAARIAVDRRALASHPALKLKPGMPAEVFVETGSRSMISYLTKPLRDQFARAFRHD